MTEAGKVSVRGKAMAKKFVRYKERFRPIQYRDDKVSSVGKGSWSCV